MEADMLLNDPMLPARPETTATLSHLTEKWSFETQPALHVIRNMLPLLRIIPRAGREASDKARGTTATIRGNIQTALALPIDTPFSDRFQANTLL